MVRTICPSAPMRTKALGVNAPLWAASAAPIEGPVVKPMTRPPPTAALTLKKRRRERSTPSLSTRSIIRLQVMSAPLLVVRRVLDRFADANICAAAADVSRHRIVDIGIVRMRILRKQRRGRHDLPRLAIAALRDLEIEPRLLNLPAGRRLADGFDRGDLFPDDRR